jgi:hypothetical protein
MMVIQLKHNLKIWQLIGELTTKDPHSYLELIHVAATKDPHSYLELIHVAATKDSDWLVQLIAVAGERAEERPCDLAADPRGCD